MFIVENKKSIFKIKELPILLVLIVGCVIVSLLTPYFLTPNNIFNVLRQISVYAILAIGEALIIITGEIDLSIGYMMGLCGVLTALMAKAGVPAVLIVMHEGVVTGNLKNENLSQDTIMQYASNQVEQAEAG